MTWEQLCKMYKSAPSALSITKQAGALGRYISIYQNGVVYIGDARGSMVFLKHCPYPLMYQIVEQFLEENQRKSPSAQFIESVSKVAERGLSLEERRKGRTIKYHNGYIDATTGFCFDVYVPGPDDEDAEELL